MYVCVCVYVCMCVCVCVYVYVCMCALDNRELKEPTVLDLDSISADKECTGLS